MKCGDYAAQNKLDVDKALDSGMKEQAEAFRASGSELYSKA